MNESQKLVERLMGAPAPVAPPRPVRPDTRPAPGPVAPPRPGVPDPWRRKELRPGHEPRPKMRQPGRPAMHPPVRPVHSIRAEAEEFMRQNGLESFLAKP